MFFSNPREVITKSKVSLKGPRDRGLRKNPQCSRAQGTDDATDSAGLPGSSPLSLMCDPPPRQEPATALVQGEDAVCTCVPGGADTDGGSDLSDMERLPGPPSVTGPPQLHLRAEALDRCDFWASPPPSRGLRRHRDGYPDFLPPPFNSWSLQQLATYLNTDGRGIPRPRPASQLERYLERLLQLEWQQIQTVQEESNVSTCAARHWPQAPPHCSLSAPKTILHCPRAFPLALLSSLADALPVGACPSCRHRCHAGDSVCRPRAHPHCSHASPLPEGSARPAAACRRSSSETRTRQFERTPAPRHHRLSDPLDGSGHLKRMQAIGNIRNPAGAPCGAQCVSNTRGLESSVLRERGPTEGEGWRRTCGAKPN
uniref:Family with sequence similarity 217 member Bb n=1 Tax=Electrophorus electricus TaxID=8005 RepID=A0AAY5EEJ9_ELEEL